MPIELYALGTAFVVSAWVEVAELAEFAVVFAELIDLHDSVGFAEPGEPFEPGGFAESA